MARSAAHRPYLSGGGGGVRRARGRPGIIIPKAARDRILGAELDSMTSLVGFLEAQGTLPPMEEALAGGDYKRFDGVVRGGLLGGGNLRVKLWNLVLCPQRFARFGRNLQGCDPK